MTTFMRRLLFEQLTLYNGAPLDPMWEDRLAADDAVAELGDTFIANTLTTPNRVGYTSLVPEAALDEVGDWLRSLYVRPEDDLFEAGDTTAAEAPALSTESLGRSIGVDLAALPPLFGGWRLTTEIYVLSGRSLYAVGAEITIRGKVLAEEELGIAYSRRMLPFLPDGEELTGSMLFVVGVPGRTAAFGGLRGYRRGLLHAGAAIAQLQALVVDGPGRWLWETEFYDDACCRVLGVDGWMRVPLCVAAHLAPGEEE